MKDMLIENTAAGQNLDGEELSFSVLDCSSSNFYELLESVLLRIVREKDGLPPSGATASEEASPKKESKKRMFSRHVRTILIITGADLLTFEEKHALRDRLTDLARAIMFVTTAHPAELALAGSHISFAHFTPLATVAGSQTLDVLFGRHEVAVRDAAKEITCWLIVSQLFLGKAVSFQSWELLAREAAEVLRQFRLQETGESLPDGDPTQQTRRPGTNQQDKHEPLLELADLTLFERAEGSSHVTVNAINAIMDVLDGVGSVPSINQVLGFYFLSSRYLRQF